MITGHRLLPQPRGEGRLPCSIRRGDTQTAVHLSDAIDQDRLNQHVGGYRVEVTDPLHNCGSSSTKPRASQPISPGRACSTSSRSSRTSCGAGNRVTLDAQRFAQLGTWSGQIVDRRRGDRRRPVTWIGTRDRSWGIRPIGEPEPAGRPADPPFEGMWWLYVPMAFDDFGDRDDHPGGAQTGSARSTTAPGSGATAGSNSWAGRGSRSTTAPAPASPPARPSTPPRPTAPRCTSRWNPNCRCRFTSAAATAATRTGCTACGRARSSPSGCTYDMTDPAIIGRSGFGVIDHVGPRGVPRRRRRPGGGLGSLRARRAGPPRPVRLRRLAHRRALTLTGRRNCIPRAKSRDRYAWNAIPAEKASQAAHVPRYGSAPQCVDDRGHASHRDRAGLVEADPVGDAVDAVPDVGGDLAPVCRTPRWCAASRRRSARPCPASGPAWTAR